MAELVADDFVLAGVVGSGFANNWGRVFQTRPQLFVARTAGSYVGLLRFLDLNRSLLLHFYLLSVRYRQCSRTTISLPRGPVGHTFDKKRSASGHHRRTSG